MTDPELVVDLLRAARAWRVGLIPNTSTGLAGPTAMLLRAIEAIEACDHPRGHRVFYGDSTRQSCGKCGADVDA